MYLARICPSRRILGDNALEDTFLRRGEGDRARGEDALADAFLRRGEGDRARVGKALADAFLRRGGEGDRALADTATRRDLGLTPPYVVLVLDNRFNIVEVVPSGRKYRTSPCPKSYDFAVKVLDLSSIAGNPLTLFLLKRKWPPSSPNALATLS
jgi:hypothetical protein